MSCADGETRLSRGLIGHITEYERCADPCDQHSLHEGVTESGYSY